MRYAGGAACRRLDRPRPRSVIMTAAKMEPRQHPVKAHLPVLPIRTKHFGYCVQMMLNALTQRFGRARGNPAHSDTNNFAKPFRKPTISFAPSFDAPYTRSTKTMGTSSICNPAYRARTIISIWKAYPCTHCAQLDRSTWQIAAAFRAGRGGGEVCAAPVKSDQTTT